MSCEVKTIRVIKNDSTSAFGTNLFRVAEPHIAEGYEITKIIIQIGTITKKYENPEYPFVVNLSSEETNRLKTGINPVNVLLVDGNGQPKTGKMNPFLQVIAEEKKVEQ